MVIWYVWKLLWLVFAFDLKLVMTGNQSNWRENNLVYSCSIQNIQNRAVIKTLFRGSIYLIVNYLMWYKIYIYNPTPVNKGSATLSYSPNPFMAFLRALESFSALKLAHGFTVPSVTGSYNAHQTHPHTCTYTYKHTQYLTSPHTHTHTHTHTPVQAHTHAYKHTHMPTSTHTDKHTHTHTQWQAHAHTHTHTHAHTHTHTHTHTHNCTFIQLNGHIIRTNKY